MQSSLSSKAPRSEAPSAREFHLVAAVQQLALCTDSAGIIEVLRVAARSLTSADGVTVVLREGDLCLGVGLSLARRLVELHGGRIQAASAGRDHGAQFSVHLPLAADAALRADHAPREMNKKDGAKRVLVVDDNVDAARTLALLVDAMGHEVVEVAHDGGAAVDLARRRPPELVFLDIAMPGMDGHEVARRLREMQQPMYIVALTGYGGDEARARSHAAGFDRHLVKPVDPNALESLLAAA